MSGRKWPWQRWSNWCVTGIRGHAGASKEVETGRYLFRWMALLVRADRVAAACPPHLWQELQTRRTVPDA